MMEKEKKKHLKALCVKNMEINDTDAVVIDTF